ncbi:MAG TPA: TonB-dependent receptor [Gemmatimonadales bacterium]|nr:TonB-dependent receptor [Gemmatimonadales bacterium]
MRAGWSLRVLVLVSLGVAGPVRAQTRADLTGQVVDSATGAPLTAVEVTLHLAGGAIRAATTTDDRGRYRLRGIASGTYQLRARRVGYRPYARDGVRVPADAGTPLRISLVAVGIPLDPVVVSASRTAQTRLDAPASVTVVGREAIAAAPALTPIGHVAEATGMDVARKGILQSTYAVRGEVSANSGALLTLTDYRYAEVPSLAINVPYLIPAIDDDIERIELERGPGTALYGPNSARGVLLILTRSPFDSRGGTLSITGGTRSFFQGSGRYAFTLGDRLGVKVSGQYVRAHDWPYTDPAEADARDTAIAHGADPATLLVGKRDYQLERGAAEARVDWRVDPRTTAIVTAGLSDAFNVIDQTTVGAAQARDWRYGFLQTRVRHDRFFANAVYNLSDAGNTYFLRTGALLVDKSRVFAAEVQNGARFGPTDVVYGVDGRWTDPRTGGTIDGRNESNDRVAELGAYASTTTALGSRVDLVAALRGDHHSRLRDFVLSPRVGVVVKPSRTAALRLTYNRAFTSPSANDLFIDINEGVLDPRLPYHVYATGIPPSGFTFRRDCGGTLCMRSPFAGGGGYVPADATVTWQQLVAIAGTYGFDLAGVPAPTASDVGTRLAVIDPSTKSFIPVTPSSVSDIAPPRRTILNTLELGYKGVLGRNVYLEVDGYVNHLDGVTGPYTDVTPSVFYDQTTLARYLARYLPANEAAQIAQVASQLPAGTVVPTQATGSDPLIVQRQGGGYTIWGADVTLRMALGHGFDAQGSYSWVSNDSIPNVPDVGAVSLNVPRNKAYLAVGYRNDPAGLTARLSGRAIESFPVSSGDYIGRVPGYVVFDATAGVRLPVRQNLRLQVTAYNVLDNRHQEFVGAPVIGRLLLTELHVSF